MHYTCKPFCHTISYICCLFLISCISRTPPLEHALMEAGENRSELEAVLAHYSRNTADSLKYKAAVFLIENMPGHTGYAKEQMDSLTDSMLPILRSSVSLSDKQNKIEKICSQWDSIHGPLKIEQDIQSITSEYLIDNIDSAFELWENEPWCQHLTFDEFCEFILPYRCIELQPLDNWRRDNRSTFSFGLDNKLRYALRQNKYSLQACREVYNEIRRQFGLVEIYFPFTPGYKGYPLLSAKLLAENKSLFKSCCETAQMTMINMRSAGIPIAVDFTPQWAERSMGHTWNALLTNEKNIVEFGSFTDEEPGFLRNPWENIVKVFRYTYRRNPDLYNLNQKEKIVPSVFQNVFVKDVTDEYMHTVNLSIPVRFNRQKKTKYGYLAAYDNTNWRPLDFGERIDDKIRFKNIGPTAALLPMIVDAKTHTFVSTNYPFTVSKNNEIQYFVPDTTHWASISLKRKYPPSFHSAEGGRRLMNGLVQAADNPEFINPVTFSEFETWQPSVTIHVDTLPAYRYWRYISPENMPIAMAEMIFIDAADTTKKLTGRIFGTPGCIGDRVPENLFDNDLLTWYESHNHGRDWIGVDFGAPVALDKVICYAVSDANSIEFGNLFELFYHNGEGWVSLGRKTAYDATLYYTAPSGNPLFVLKNLTKGVETRIFTYDYEKQKQIWW